MLIFSIRKPAKRIKASGTVPQIKHLIKYKWRRNGKA
jgi:hypothetical protein